MAEKIQYLSCVKKVSEKIKTNWGIDDKDTAEFVIDMAKEAEDAESYHDTLKEMGLGSGDPDFSAHLYDLVTNMLRTQTKRAVNVNGGSSSSTNSGTVRPAKTADEDQWASLRIKDDQGRDELKAGLTSKEDVSSTAQRLFDEMMTEEERRRQGKKGHGKKGRKDSRSSATDANSIPLGGGTGERERSPRRGPRSRLEILQENRREPVTRFMVYACRVKKIMDTGAVIVSFETAVGHKDGIVHVNELTRDSVSKAVVRCNVNQECFAKVKLSVTDGRTELSMREVDQSTGEDLMPSDRNGPKKESAAGKARKAQFAAKDRGELTNVPLTIADTLGGGKKNRMKFHMSDREVFDNNLFERAVGRAAAQQFNPNAGMEENMEDDELEEEYEVETKEQEPNFLKNQTAKSGVVLEPIRLVKAPEGSLAQSAANAETSMKETREAREAMVREQVNNVPKDMNKPWEDPSPEPGTRAITQVLIFFASASFGKVCASERIV